MMSEHTFEAHSKVGTPLYMSPEVLRGDGYDWKSDVWSLGCVLYELAVLKSPFIDKKSREQFQTKVHKRVVDIVNSTPKTVESLMKLDLPSGVDIEIRG